MYRKLRNLFLSGLAVLLPVAVTAYLLIWLLSATDRLFLRFMEPVSGPLDPPPGSGVLLAIGLTLATGALMRIWGLRYLLDGVQRLMARTPIVKAVYGPLRELADLFNPNGQSVRGAPVALRLGDYGEVVGFVTTEQPAVVPPWGAAGEDDDTVAVYLPMSYQLGGYTLYTARSRLRRLDMSAEEAMRLTLTAGLGREPAKGQRAGGETAAPAHGSVLK